MSIYVLWDVRRGVVRADKLTYAQAVRLQEKWEDITDAPHIIFPIY
jgi:hypothetical protein